MFSNPEVNLKHISVFPGMKVADIGSGSGQYTLALAREVGGDGCVYAVDVQKDLLEKLKNEAQRQHLSAVEVIWGDAEIEGGTKIKAGTIDLAIVANVLFQAEDKEGLAKEVARIVKPKGKVLVVDWQDSFNGLGPHPEHVVVQQKAEEIFTKAGFTKEKDFSGGDHHYGILFIKQ